jgi:hypothetical protein
VFGVVIDSVNKLVLRIIILCLFVCLGVVHAESISIHLKSGTTLIGEIQSWDGEKGVVKTDFGDISVNKENLTEESLDAISRITTIGSPLNIHFKSGSVISGKLKSWDGSEGVLATEVGEIKFNKDKVVEEMLPLLSKITRSASPTPQSAPIVATSPTPTPTPSDPVAYQKSAKYAVIVEGEATDGGGVSQGSGFLVHLNNKIYLFTNIHVISGNRNVTAKGMNGKILKLGNLMVANNCDLAAFELPEEKEGLEILDQVDKNITINNELAILGNSLGGRVTTEIRGKVSAIGPNLVETDAKFVHGNSGSPAIDVKTGKVVAIATYAETPDGNKLTKDSKFNKITRRYCYRLDTIDKWVPVTWSDFMNETSFVQNAENKTEDLYSIIYTMVVDQKIPFNYGFKCRHTSLERSLQSYAKEKAKALETTASRNNSDQFIEMAKSFFRTVSGECINDINFRAKLNYDSEKIKEMLATRLFLKEQLDGAAQKLQVDPNFYLH